MIGSQTLRIERETLAAGDLLTLHGEFDLMSAGMLDDVLATTGACVTILDLGELSFLDSAGIRAIDRAHRRLKAQRRTLRIVARGGSRAAWTLRAAGFPDELVLPSVEAVV